MGLKKISNFIFHILGNLFQSIKSYTPKCTRGCEKQKLRRESIHLDTSDPAYLIKDLVDKAPEGVLHVAVTDDDAARVKPQMRFATPDQMSSQRFSFEGSANLDSSSLQYVGHWFVSLTRSVRKAQLTGPERLHGPDPKFQWYPRNFASLLHSLIHHHPDPASLGQISLHLCCNGPVHCTIYPSTKSSTFRHAL